MKRVKSDKALIILIVAGILSVMMAVIWRCGKTDVIPDYKSQPGETRKGRRDVLASPSHYPPGGTHQDGAGVCLPDNGGKIVLHKGVTQASRCISSGSTTTDHVQWELKIREKADPLITEHTMTSLETLFGVIANMPPSELKEELGRRAAGCMGVEHLPLLLKLLATSDDAIVQASIKLTLTQKSTSETVGALLGVYSETSDENTRTRILNILRCMQNPKAAEAMINQIAPSSSGPGDGVVADACIQGLAHLNSAPAVYALLRRLEVETMREQHDALVQVILSINSEEGRIPLENAALGQKNISDPMVRSAAILALTNYPDANTLTVLQHVEGGGDKTLAAAAAFAARSVETMLAE